jgi:hypothetical protein
METGEQIGQEISLAVAEMEALLAECTDAQAEVRCGDDSKTVAAHANHVVGWLELLADMAPSLSRGARLPTAVVEEIDAGFVKASVHRSLKETRLRLSDSAERLRRACRGLDEADLTAPVAGMVPVVSVAAFLRRWAITRVKGHSAAIRAGLLVAPGRSAT